MERQSEGEREQEREREREKRERPEYLRPNTRISEYNNGVERSKRINRGMRPIFSSWFLT